jgi:dienelactone hydrolase
MRSTVRYLLMLFAALALTIASPQTGAGPSSFHTLDDRYPPPRFSSVAEWQRRAADLREHVLESAGLLPFPEKTPLRPVVFGEITHEGYTVSKVYFESLPGFFVTGNLYRPVGDGPFPAVLSPHGHWTYGRLENTPLTSAPGRAINLARQGFVVFTYDMIGYNDSRQLTHTFGGRREALWGLSLSGLQLWNSIRGLDFLESLPYVKRDALGATGESGGGTQTFLLAAVDNRVAAAVPVNMISLHMQGGCLCENPPGLRLDTTNVEIAATIAPRPLLMVSATGDWTNETLEAEYPAVRSIYTLLDADDHVSAVRFTADHNYNKDSREAMYAWMARWLQHGPADARRAESSFTPDPLPDLLVFHNRVLPEGALDANGVTSAWIAAARRQIAATPLEVRRAALRHALAFARSTAAVDPAVTKRNRRVVLLAGDEASMMESALGAAGFSTRIVAFTPFDAEAAARVRHFETYNRTAASQRVLDIVTEARAHPGAVLVASGAAAVAGALAAAVAPVRLSILDVGHFDTTGDADFLDRLYIPGLRRAGDFQTAADMASGGIVFHNAGPRFDAGRARVTPETLTPAEIIALLR